MEGAAIDAWRALRRISLSFADKSVEKLTTLLRAKAV